MHNIPVVKNDIVGIVTRTDLVRYVAENDEEIKTKISKLMTEDIISVHRHHTINHVIDEMNRNEIERVVVKDDAGKPVGIISSKSLALNLLTDFQGELSTKNIKMTR